VSGNIGAKPVQSAAGALEKLIRDQAKADDVNSAIQETAGVLRPLVKQLETALSSLKPESTTPPAPSAPVDPARSREAAAQLMKLLAEFDPAASDLIESKEILLCPLFSGGKWGQFQKLVQGYSFAEAQVQLEEALKKM
jgi:hypothetical protein